MVDTPETEPVSDDATEERVAQVIEGADRMVRVALTGDPKGRLRRPVLFVIVALGLVWTPLALLGLASLILLALTDAIMELNNVSDN